MIAQGRRQAGPLNLEHLFAERHAGQFFLDAFPLGGARGGTQPVCEFKESAFFCFSRFDAAFDQFHQDVVCAGALILGERSNAASKAWRKRHALTHGFFSSCHEESIHHNAPFRTMERGEHVHKGAEANSGWTPGVPPQAEHVSQELASRRGGVAILRRGLDVLVQNRRGQKLMLGRMA